MSDKTTYVVETRLEAADHASKTMEHVGHAAEEAGEKTEGLKETLKELGEGFLVFEGLEKVKEVFIGANSEAEQLKMQLSSTFGANFHKSFEEAGESVNELWESFEHVKDSFPAGAEELARAAQSLSSAVGSAGGNMEDLRVLTERGAIAQKAFGLETMQLYMMLEGRVSKRSPGGMNLLNILGVSPEEWEKFSAQKRMALTERALKSDVVTEAGARFAGTYSGQVSVLKDRVEDIFKEGGQGFFHAITDEIASWNEWLVRNKEEIKEFAAKLGGDVLSVFHALKDVASFLYDHADVLITIAKVWASVKIGSAVGSIMESGISGLTGLMSKMSGMAAGVATGGGLGAGVTMAGVTSNMSLLTAIGGASYELTTLAMDVTGFRQKMHEWIDPMGDKFDKLAASMKVYDDTVNELEEKNKGKLGADNSNQASLLKTNIEMNEKVMAAVDRFDKEAAKGPGYELGDWKKRQRQAYAAAGMDPDEVNRMVGSPEARKAMREKLEPTLQHERGNLSAADRMVDTQLRLLNAHQKDHLNELKATNALMAEQLSIFSKGGGVMNGADVAKFLAAHKELYDEQTRVNQTINVKIEQVTAKDPDRWIADLDEYASRRARSRTRAKGAPARGH